MHANAPSPVARPLAGGPLHDALMAQIPAATRPLSAAPRLVIVRVGDDPASHAFVRRKLARCAAVGIKGEEIHLHAGEGEAAMLSLLHGLAHDAAVNAIIVQLPLPVGWQVEKALAAIPAAKDCDGLAPANVEARRAGQPVIAPATPLGVMRLLSHINFEVAGKTAAVIGKGRVAGAPMREMLAAAGAKVVAIDRDTPQPAHLARGADLLIAAAGVPGLVTDAWVKPGAVVIDIGLTRTEVAGRALLRGDVDAAAVAPLAAWLTPVPGGVGPMTVASLLTNVVDCARLQAGLPPVAWVAAPALTE